MKKGEVHTNIHRGLLFVLGVFLVALNYNMFILPNSLVIGGTSGIAVILKETLHIDPVLFLYSINVLLIVISFIFLGVKKTSKTIIGALLYPLFISITSPIALYLNITFENPLIMILVSSIILGIGNGLVYKTGFTTGGSDIVAQLVNNRGKISFGRSIMITNILIILAGGLFFTFENVIYAIIIIYINSVLVDRILLGISNSKMVFIYTKQEKKVKRFILNDIETGITVIDVEGGYTKKKDKMFMVVVRTRDYILFKEKIMTIDSSAFLIVSDCYEVLGGVKRRNLPFISN